MVTRSRALILVLCVWGTAAYAGQSYSYLSPTLIEAGNALFPTSGPSVAAISLLATVESDGHISETETVDSIGSTLTGGPYEGTLVGYVEDSIAAAKLWRFNPAVDLNLKATRSIASITFVYETVSGFGADTSTIPEMKTVLPKAGEYLPPLPRRVSRVEYPIRGSISTPTPTVVLNLEIAADGSILGTDVIQSVPALDALSKRDVKNFRFQPARYQGKPIRSTAIVAIAFLPPLQSPSQ